MGGGGEDMQPRTRAGIKPGSLLSGRSLKGTRSTQCATGAPPVHPYLARCTPLIVTLYTPNCHIVHLGLGDMTKISYPDIGHSVSEVPPSL